MRTLLASIALLTLTAQTVHAGGYLSVGLGSDALLGGDLENHFNTNDLSINRLAIGYRISAFAIEGAMTGADLRATSSQILGQSSGGDEFSTTSLGVDVKYYVGIAGSVEGYARGGINKTWLTAGSGIDTALDYQGRSYAIGGGLQYTFRLLPAVGGAVWIDYHRQMLDLSDGQQPSIGGTADMFTIGVSVGTGL